MKKLLERLRKQKKKIAIFLVVDFSIVPLLLMIALKALFSELEAFNSLGGFNFNYFIAIGINAMLFHYIGYKLIFKDTIDSLDVNIFNIIAILAFALYVSVVYTLFANKDDEIVMDMISAIVMLIVPVSFFMIRDIVARAYSSDSETFFMS